MLLTYDSLGRTTSETSGPNPISSYGKTASYAYDGSDNLTGITYPVGSFSVARTVDDVNRLTLVEDGSSNGIVAIGHDATSGRMETLTFGNGTTTTFGHDGFGRITSIDHATSSPASFAGYAMGHDRVGNIVFEEWTHASGKGNNHAYDRACRLTKALMGTEDPGAGHASPGSEVYDHRFVYNLTDDSDRTSVVTNPHVDDDDTSELVRLYFHVDPRTNVAYLTGPDESVVESYVYDPYGNVTIRDQAGDPVAASPVGNPFTFQRRRLDAETGLYYFRARHYDPVAGQWMQRDPLGAVESGSPRQFVLSNPVVNTDPLGLTTVVPPKITGRKEYGGGVILTITSAVKGAPYDLRFKSATQNGKVGEGRDSKGEYVEYGFDVTYSAKVDVTTTTTLIWVPNGNGFSSELMASADADATAAAATWDNSVNSMIATAVCSAEFTATEAAHGVSRGAAAQGGFSGGVGAAMSFGLSSFLDQLGNCLTLSSGSQSRAALEATTQSRVLSVTTVTTTEAVEVVRQEWARYYLTAGVQSETPEWRSDGRDGPTRFRRGAGRRERGRSWIGGEW